jgi:hypothetical protein
MIENKPHNPASLSTAPESRSSAPVRIAAYVLLAALVIAIILLALGVVNFEQNGWFK